MQCCAANIREQPFPLRAEGVALLREGAAVYFGRQSNNVRPSYSAALLHIEAEPFASVAHHRAPSTSGEKNQTSFLFKSYCCNCSQPTALTTMNVFFQHRCSSHLHSVDINA